MKQSYFNAKMKLAEGLTPEVVGRCYEEGLLALQTCTESVKESVAEAMEGITKPSDKELRAARKAVVKERKAKWKANKKEYENQRK